MTDIQSASHAETQSVFNQLSHDLSQDEAVNAKMTHELSVAKEQICQALETLQIQEEEIKRRRDRISNERSFFASQAPGESSTISCNYELLVAERDQEISRLTELVEQLKKDHASAQSSLRDEMLSKQSELESVKFKLTYSEKAEKQSQLQLEKANEKLNALVSQHQQETDQLKSYILVVEKERDDLAAQYQGLTDRTKVWINALKEKLAKKSRELTALGNQNAELSKQLDFQESLIEKLAEDKRLLIEDLAAPPPPPISSNQIPTLVQEKKSVFGLTKNTSIQ